MHTTVGEVALNSGINGHLHYPADMDSTLNEAAADKILQYRADYNNRPSHAISFMSAIDSTSGRLHGEFVCLLFLQDHRETDFFHLQEYLNIDGSPITPRSHTHLSCHD